MTPGLFDHALFVVLVLLMPLWALRQHRALLSSIAAGDPDARLKVYIRTMVVEWALAGLVIWRWATAGALPGVLGAGDPGSVRWWVGAALVLAACVLLIWQTIVVLRSPARLQQLRAQVEPLRGILPGNAREGRVFNGLSVTAGICEEILYRGFLIAYLASLYPMWIAVLGSSAVFGMGHAYQGRAGIFKTGLVGLVMAVLYLLTGSVWAPALVHAAIDLNSGYLGRRALQGSL